MMRIFFFAMGVPMMILSFFEAIQVMPFVESYDLIYDGNRIELTEEETETLQQHITALFENARTMPAYGVVTDEVFQEEIKDGYFVSLKFNHLMELNQLPFDELVFKIQENSYGVDLMRGVKGVVQGRCIHLDFQKDTIDELFDYVSNLRTEESFEENEEGQTEIEEPNIEEDNLTQEEKTEEEYLQGK